MERTANPKRTLHPDTTAHQPSKLRDDGKTEAGAAELPCGRCIRLRERVKDRRMLLDRDSDSSVRHADVQDIAGGALDPHHHFAAFRELDRVADEIDDDLPQTTWVADQ